VRLRPPALLKVNLSNEYPRCYVTRRILSDGGLYFGPFPSRRVAQAFADKFLDLFKIRRCQIKIRRDPSFPGCIYSEMKMCLAPCFAGCSKEEYDVEVGRVVSFLTSSGAALAGEFERERAAASEALDFECAAALHRKLEKVAEVLRGLPELARKLDELDAVIVQCAAEESAVAIFAVRGGRIADPFFLRFGELASQPRSVEEILRESLTAVDLKGVDQGPLVHETHDREALVEHLALLARWFYSKPREGEIFFRQRDWPYRRIIRACSRLLAPPASPPRTPDPQRGADSA
jgi:excinuclease UvrABC nuclease subunit